MEFLLFVFLGAALPVCGNCGRVYEKDSLQKQPEAAFVAS
jgi:hypothetical protein